MSSSQQQASMSPKRYVQYETFEIFCSIFTSVLFFYQCSIKKLFNKISVEENLTQSKSFDLSQPSPIKTHIQHLTQALQPERSCVILDSPFNFHRRLSSMRPERRITLEKQQQNTVIFFKVLLKPFLSAMMYTVSQPPKKLTRVTKHIGFSHACNKQVPQPY